MASRVSNRNRNRITARRGEKQLEQQLDTATVGCGVGEGTEIGLGVGVGVVVEVTAGVGLVVEEGATLSATGMQ